MKFDLKTIDELGTLDRGRSRHRPRDDQSLYGGKYPFVQTGDVKHAPFYISSYSQTYNEKGLAQSKLWKKGTLCITIAANIADSAILNFDACFPDSVLGFIPFPDESDTRFVKYCFDIYKSTFEAISKGTTQDNLSLEKIKTIKFRAPPLPVQRKIAAVLSAYDDLIENNKRRIAILEKMTEELYREWFVRLRFPGHEKAKIVKGVPEGWKARKIGELLTRVAVGKRFDNKTVLENGRVPVLDQSQSGIIGYHNEVPGVIASSDDPIITFANHTCYQRLIHFPFSTIQNVLPFRPASSCLSNIYWLHYATKDLITFSEYKGHWPEFIAKALYYPGYELTERFGSLIKPIVIKMIDQTDANKVLSTTRDRLLSRLMSGKINVEDLDIAFPKSMAEEGA